MLRQFALSRAMERHQDNFSMCAGANRRVVVECANPRPRSFRVALSPKIPAIVELDEDEIGDEIHQTNKRCSIISHASTNTSSSTSDIEMDDHFWTSESSDMDIDNEANLTADTTPSPSPPLPFPSFEQNMLLDDSDTNMTGIHPRYHDILTYQAATDRRLNRMQQTMTMIKLTSLQSSMMLDDLERELKKVTSRDVKDEPMFEHVNGLMWPVQDVGEDETCWLWRRRKSLERRGWKEWEIALVD